MIVSVVDADAVDGRLDEIEQVVLGAFPPGSALMDAAFLRWALLEPEQRPLGTRAAIAVDGGRVVGFAAAAPWPLHLGEVSAFAYLLSFVSVAADRRGLGLGRKLYDALLRDLHDRIPTAAIVTFAQDGTTGSHLIEECYPAGGWSGIELEAMQTWGTVRGKLKRAAAGEQSLELAGRLALTITPFVQRWLERDPRWVATTTCGARITNIAIAGKPGASIGVIDALPGRISSQLLHELVARSERDLPVAADRIVISSLPVSAAPIAASAGLRRLPSPLWRAWVWSRSPGHPFLAAQSTSCPIT